MNYFFQILKNRYFLTLLAFLLWMSFLDRDDLFSQISLDNKLSELETQKNFYLNGIIKLKTSLEGIHKDPKKLEKLAREKYYMRKENEDVFVLVEDSNNTRSTFSTPIPRKVNR